MQVKSTEGGPTEWRLRAVVGSYVLGQVISSLLTESRKPTQIAKQHIPDEMRWRFVSSRDSTAQVVQMS